MDRMLKILIIDNNRTFRQMLADMLQTNLASEVRSLNADDPDILHQFKQFSPDVLLMDVQSTEKNCLTFTKNFKGLQPGLCVVWITSCDTPEYPQKGRDGGIDDCLSKDSITSDGIINLIRVVSKACDETP